LASIAAGSQAVACAITAPQRRVSISQHQSASVWSLVTI
jgi:hypothetical protein